MISVDKWLDLGRFERSVFPRPWAVEYGAQKDFIYIFAAKLNDSSRLAVAKLPLGHEDLAHLIVNLVNKA